MSEKTHAYLQHHFANKEQQYESAKLGMWAFLVTEVLTFSGLFCAYVIFRNKYPATFELCGDLLNTELGLINTIVLITSSLTMALAIYYIQNDDKTKTIQCLGVTLILAAAFMVIKYFEYTHKIHVGQLPTEGFFYPNLPESVGEGANKEMIRPGFYFSIYFMMTGLHGIHVVIGMGLILWLIIRTMRGHFSPAYYTPVEMVGLFWHLVDLVWIFLFPLLYLIG